jgi:hypothetical protein
MGQVKGEGIHALSSTRQGQAMMIPKTVTCHECGRTANVRGYGRVEYDWPKTVTGGQTATMPLIKSIRLTVDCPRCGVKPQEFHPH